MFFNKRLKDDNFSPLSKACFKAFWPIKGSLIQTPPQELSSVLKQPLYGNPLILEEEDITLGMGPNVGLHILARAGITKVAHL